VLVIAAACVFDDSRRSAERRAMFAVLFGLNVFALFIAAFAPISAFLQVIYGTGLMAVGAVVMHWTFTEGSMLSESSATAS
jgi:hypothetical protein